MSVSIGTRCSLVRNYAELHEILSDIEPKDKEELENEILATRRIATFRAVRIAMLQEERDKIIKMQDAHRSVVDLKDRENDRLQVRALLCLVLLPSGMTLQGTHQYMQAYDTGQDGFILTRKESSQASLLTAGSKITRMQQECRRLNRLLGNRMDFASDVNTLAREHAHVRTHKDDKSSMLLS